MTWYRFEWEAFVTDDLISQIGDAAGHGDTDEVRGRVASRLVRLLEVVGGAPITDHQFDSGERTQLAAAVLHRAVTRILAAERARVPPGFVVITDGDASTHTLSAFHRVDVNRATLGELDRLPSVGVAIARAIVEERTAHGAFRDVVDLVDRVHGLGSGAQIALANTAAFSAPTARPPLRLTGTLVGDLGVLVGLQDGADGLQRLDAALDVLVGRVAAERIPHAPLGDWRLPATDGGPTTTVNEIVVLAGSAYFNELPSLFAAATGRIDVCMFHMAFPSASHPTGQLLQALVEAQQRGVSVRVLLDQDRPTDPYLSTVINGPATAHLAAAGVTVRMDRADMLLHSKFILVDEDLTLIGSHNWSAGSYFHFDDLTLALRSSTLTAQQRTRFDRLWSLATAT